MTNQQPPGASNPSTLTPRTFRFILAAVFLVGSMLPVLRGCNTSWNSFEVVLILTESFPTNLLVWLVLGSLLFLASLVTIALYTFSSDDAQRPLFNRIWAFALSGYVLVAFVFVIQNSEVVGIGLGWIILTLTAIVGHIPSQVMKLLRVQLEEDANLVHNAVRQAHAFPLTQGSSIHHSGSSGQLYPPPVSTPPPPPPLPGAAASDLNIPPPLPASAALPIDRPVESISYSKEVPMSLVIDAAMAEKLPATVKSALAKMSSDQQMMFQQEYRKKAKSTGLYVALAILFPIQLFLLGKAGLGVLFLLTAGGFWIWYIVEWFLTPKRVREYNEGIATSILTNIKVMGS